MADATAGDEAAAWEDATSFLRQVEVDARNAEEHAMKAAAFVLAADNAQALIEINKAVDLESKHRDSVVWKPMRGAIAALA